MKNKIMQPLSAGFCATVLAIAGSVTANVAASAVLPSKAFALASTSNSGEPDSSLPPVRTSLTKEEAEQMEGCEAYFDSAKHEFVIRPKNGANEGVISYSIANKKGDFETIRKKLIFDGDSDEVSVRFDKRVYIYGSTDATSNDTLFYQINVKTINITDNLNIKFAKNLAKFFMQDYRKSADHLNYIKGVENWDTSHVESMEKMFNLASQLEGKLDLSKWDVSGADKLNLMFSGVGNDNFVLDFSNKKFKNSVDVTNMFNSFRGVLVANNWTVADPSGDNPIQKLVDNSSWMLTHWDASAHAYIGPSYHLLITDNPTILTKNQTAKYKFYKKVKVIYKINGTEKSVELELPAVYDSRIDANGKPDEHSAASSDPMKVIKPQIKEAIQKAITQLRTENPSLNLPQNVIPVPVKEILDSDSPAALFQDYYLGLVKEETVKAKTTYTADPTLTYQQVVTDTQAVDGKKQVITGKMVNGVWQADATDEKEISAVVDGKARVGNVQKTTAPVAFKTEYKGDANTTYGQQVTETQGKNGESTTTTTYKVDATTGKLSDPTSTTEETTPVTNQVVKVGNVQKTTAPVAFKTEYKGDANTTYGQQVTETQGKNGESTTTTTYKVDSSTGKLSDPTSTTEETTPVTNQVVKVGNVQKTTAHVAFKTEYKGDANTTYGQQVTETQGKNGESTTTTTYKVDATTGKLSDPTSTTEETTPVTNQVVKVGNVQKTTAPVAFKTEYKGDANTTYGQQVTETQGKNGESTTTTTYKVDSSTGKLSDPTSTTEETTPVTNQVVKVGNVDTKTEEIPFTTTYVDDPNLDEGTTSIVTAGEKGSETIVTTYEVDATTGKLSNPTSKTTVTKVATNQVVHKGTKTHQPPTPPTPPEPNPDNPGNPGGQGGDGGQGDQGGHGNDSQGGQGGEGGQGGGTGNTGTGNTGSGAGDGTHGGLNPDNPYGGHFVEPAWTYNPELNIWEWNGNGTNDHSNDGNGSNSNGSNGANSAADSAGASAGTNGSANGSNANANGANGSGTNGADENGSNGANAKNHKLSATGANASSAAFASFGSMLLGLLGLFGAASKRRSSKHSNR
ncbi:G5 domain-containing protein [Gardnerella greenwoodii]|nr:G5 domain-containing protein [Gardnerella greenwoodii]